jgi:hypothetical protein
VTLAKDPDGYDPEGLVAMPDGSFWVSDEYGPFITHFTAQGKELARLSPFKTGPEALPAELKNRVPNRGMEDSPSPPTATRTSTFSCSTNRPPPVSPTVRSRRSPTTPS